MEYSYDKEHTKKSNKTSSDHPDHNPEYKHHPTPSSSELLSSAKIVANAAKSQFQHDPNYKFDKGEVAGAAENLLHAASSYGKLDEKGGLGKMVGQAENYLHKYHSSQSTTTTTNPDHSTTTTTTTTTTETLHTKPHKDEHGHSGSGGGYGEYIKMAEGLMNKHSGSGEGGQSGGNYGDYIKMAEGMLKKQSGSESSGGQHGQGHNSGSGGYGDYIKMAGDFLKK